MTLLPKQLDRLAREAAQTGAAIGISQTGSVIHADTGYEKFSIDAQGNDTTSNQEKAC